MLELEGNCRTLRRGAAPAVPAEAYWALALAVAFQPIDMVFLESSKDYSASSQLDSSPSFSLPSTSYCLPLPLPKSVVYVCVCVCRLTSLLKLCKGRGCMLMAAKHTCSRNAWREMVMVCLPGTAGFSWGKHKAQK